MRGGIGSISLLKYKEKGYIPCDGREIKNRHQGCCCGGATELDNQNIKKKIVCRSNTVTISRRN
jgi:hypothetical protein